MPPKKASGGQKANPPETILLPEGGDPALVAIAIIDKKARNLEKRKNKLTILKNDLESGTNLDKDQLIAVARLDEVSLQLELLKELQKQFTTLQSEHQKSRKKQQKIERQQAKESEREAEKRAVSYTLRVQDILNNMGEEDKENFKAGSGGAALLTEAELSQLDELYRILTPARQGNPSYQSELDNASEFIHLMMEQSSKDVLGTTYKQLYGVVQRIDQCGYFDRPTSDNEDDDDSQEEGAADDEDYKSAEDTLTSANEMDQHAVGNYEDDTENQPLEEQVENMYIPPADVGGVIPDVISNQQEASPVTQSEMLGGFLSAPSPTFPGLGPSPIQPVADDGFSFMHDSEVDRGSMQAMQQSSTLDSTPISTSPALMLQRAPESQITPATMDYAQYTSQEGGLSAGGNHLGIVTPEGNVIQHPSTNTVAVSTVDQSGIQSGDLATTDVATGQPSPSQTDTPYQGGGVAISNAGGSMMSSAPPPNPNVYSQQLQQGNMYAGGAMDATGGYNQHFGAPLRMGNQPNRGGGGRGGSRRMGGQGPAAPKGSSGMYRNGRGMQGGYDMPTSAYGGSRGYGGGGGGNYQRGGRPNYHTGGGAGPRK